MSYLIETSIPPLYYNWDINSMVGADNLEEVKQKVDKYLCDSNVVLSGNNLYLYSIDNGTGKTSIGYWILHNLHQPRLDQDSGIKILPLASVTFGEFLKFCNESFSADAKEARRIIMTTPLLLLDDVSPAFGSGSNGNIQADRRELLLLMKYRREHLLLTIITSNLTPEAFDKLYGTTASSKVLENFSYIGVKGNDVRSAIYPDQLVTVEDDEEACR